MERLALSMSTPMFTFVLSVELFVWLQVCEKFAYLMRDHLLSCEQKFRKQIAPSSAAKKGY